jgi:general secretion pathway protein J
MRRRGQAGVTLMELMIAVTLLSLVSVGMLFALRIGLNTYQRTQSHLMDNRRVAGAQRILVDEVEGMIPVVARCGAGPEGGGMETPFFEGQPQTMRLVSAFSLNGAWRGQAQVLEIFVIPGEKEGMRLVVNEIPYVNPYQAGRFCLGGGRYPPVAPTPKSFVLADKLAICRFSYQFRLDDPTAPPVWSSVFAGRYWPTAVRIEMAPMEPDFSHLQPITVTAPLRIHRQPEIPYGDY